MSQQRPNARRSLKRPTGARGEQKQAGGQSEPSSLQSICPSRDDRAAWLAYWSKQNQPWRTEPEIRPERRAELEKCRALVPDVEKGIYPFKGTKLDRADVEWLLATYDGGPVKWSDEKEREREGLDVRGADLQHADLRQLPLTRLRGGLTFDEWRTATEEQRSSAVVLMRGANLSGAQLAGADLIGAQLNASNKWLRDRCSPKGHLVRSWACCVTTYRNERTLRRRECPTTMEILIIMVSLLVVVVALVLRIVFRGKRSNTTPGPPISPLARGPRYRDGAVTYNQRDGIRFRLRVENPYQSHPARYEHRHRPKKHTPTKPWTK